ncbi:MAG TPA: glycosyltransferase, partial [Phycisphaerae bacterium]|nr:glycosyltransferase [Phycisphaerae bacterium]
MARRVVFLITDLELGGSPLVVRRIVRGLNQTGRWEASVVSIKSPGVVGRWIRHDGTDVLSLHTRRITDVGIITRWLRMLRKLQPHVVISVLIHANALAAACAELGPPCVYFQSIHTLQQEPAWHWQLEGLIAGRCEGIIAPSRAVLARIAQFGSYRHGYVIPNGIDIDEFKNAQSIPAAERPWPAGARVIGYVGRLDPVKRLDLLLDEFAQVLISDYRRWGDLYLAIIGYGPEQKRLHKHAVQLGISSHVIFVGPTATPASWYKALDALVVASIAEGFGMSIIEAMACGTPVIVSRSPAVEEIVKHNVTGWLVEPKQSGALAAGIQTILQDQKL